MTRRTISEFNDNAIFVRVVENDLACFKQEYNFIRDAIQFEDPRTSPS